MPYSSFSLEQVIAQFGLTPDSVPDLFPGVPPRPIPAALRRQLRFNLRLAINESARSHYLIGPVLRELYEQADGRVALYPGGRLDVDAPSGLTGVCDFIVSRPPQLVIVTAPILVVAEAKNEDIGAGMGQCAAELVAAQRFNSARQSPDGPLYGVSSDGERWRFLRLSGSTMTAEMASRSVDAIDAIFGILWHICGLPPDLPVVP